MAAIFVIFHVQVRCRLSYTPVTYSRKFLGIYSMVAFLHLKSIKYDPSD